MRISDWSSDVCSSDLRAGRLYPVLDPLGRDDLGIDAEALQGFHPALARPQLPDLGVVRQDMATECVGLLPQHLGVVIQADAPITVVVERSEEGRVGKEGVGRWRSRGSPVH